MLKSKQIKYLKWFITWTENRITMPLQSILNAVCSSVSFLRLEDSKKKNQCIGQCEKQEKFPYKQQLCRLQVFRLSICVTYITHTHICIYEINSTEVSQVPQWSAAGEQGNAHSLPAEAPGTARSWYRNQATSTSLPTDLVHAQTHKQVSVCTIPIICRFWVSKSD